MCTGRPTTPFIGSLLCRFTRDLWPDSIWLLSVVGQADDFGVLRALTVLKADLGSLRLQQRLAKQVSYSTLKPLEHAFVTMAVQEIASHCVGQ